MELESNPINKESTNNDYGRNNSPLSVTTLKQKVTLFQNGYWKMQHQTFQTFHFQLDA